MEPVITYQTKNFFSDLSISLYEKRIELKEGNNKAYSKSFDKILLTDPFPVCTDSEIEFEICRFVCRQIKDKSNLKSEIKEKINFYELYKPELCEDFKFDHTVKFDYNSVDQKIKLAPFGMEIREGNRIVNVLKPDRLFFAGPYAKCLPLKVRLYLRDSIFNALGEQNVFRKEDSFPILDYDVLEKQNFAWAVDDWDKGAELKIRNGYIENNGWSSPKDGGGQTFGIEWFLHYDKSLFNLMTNQEFNDIYESFYQSILQYRIL